MTTRPRQQKRPSTDRDKPRGKLEALARRRGGHGYSFTPHALFRFRGQLGLDRFDLLVLLAILSHVGPEYTDFACASYVQLAEDTGLDRKTVINHVNRLRELELLTSTSNKKADKTNTTNVYNVQLLAEKLKDLEAKAPEPERDEVDDFDAIVTELMAEVEQYEPAPHPRSKKPTSRWATREKDEGGVDHVEGGGRRADGEGAAAIPTPFRAAAQQELASSSQKAAPSSPWRSGSSRLRPEELDDADRAQLDKGERLRHPDSRELTVDEHLYRMRELHCYSREQIANLLMDLEFPGADITAAMNANPREYFARLAGVPLPAEESVSVAPTPAPPPPVVDDDPMLRDALKAIESAQRRRAEMNKGRKS